uniref:LAGLIDADG_2 domain-containing protein n=1 Tax=Heterorhabditis bacteriophora TaxID=37862 RepID=A0A1I7WEB8_HETBA
MISKHQSSAFVVYQSYRGNEICMLQHCFPLVGTRRKYSVEYVVFGGSSYSNYFMRLSLPLNLDLWLFTNYRPKTTKSPKSGNLFRRTASLILNRRKYYYFINSYLFSCHYLNTECINKFRDTILFGHVSNNGSVISDITI